MMMEVSPDNVDRRKVPDSILNAMERTGTTDGWDYFSNSYYEIVIVRFNTESPSRNMRPLQRVGMYVHRFRSIDGGTEVEFRIDSNEELIDYYPH